MLRVSAEYANYRRRAARDIGQAGEKAVAKAATALLEIADDVERARAAGQLEGVVRGIGEKLEAAISGMGLEKYGQTGDAFNPEMHDAPTLVHSHDVNEATVLDVYQSGYRMNGRVVRAARVSVAVP